MIIKSEHGKMEKFWKKFSSNQKNVRIQIDLKRFGPIVERRLETHSDLDLNIPIEIVWMKPRPFFYSFSEKICDFFQR